MGLIVSSMLWISVEFIYSRPCAAFLANSKSQACLRRRIIHSYVAHWTAFTTNALMLQTPRPRKKIAIPSLRYDCLAIWKAPCLFAIPSFTGSGSLRSSRCSSGTVEERASTTCVCTLVFTTSNKAISRCLDWWNFSGFTQREYRSPGHNPSQSSTE